VPVRDWIQVMYSNRHWRLESDAQWAGIALVLLALAGYNIAARYRLADASEQYKADMEAAYAELADSQTAASELVGRVIRWPPTLKSVDGRAFDGETGAKDYRFVVVIDGANCMDLQSAGTRLLAELQRLVPSVAPEYVLALVKGAAIPVARSYQLANRFAFPVVLDELDAFRRANQVSIAPIVLVLNRNDIVVNAFTPAGRGRDLLPAVQPGLVRLLGAAGATPD
jgi:hypothetical protein